MSIEIMKLLNTINKNGISVVVVTHEQALVEAFNKREIRIEGGKVAFDTAKPTVSENTEKPSRRRSQSDV